MNSLRQFRSAFRKYDYGEAAATGVIIVIISVIVANFGMRLVSSLVTVETRKKR
jgi:sorbitol/mannitol transport system permease protein